MRVRDVSDAMRFVGDQGRSLIRHLARDGAHAGQGDVKQRGIG
jgi:hypothetical protein